MRRRLIKQITSTFAGAEKPVCVLDFDGVLARLRRDPARATVTRRMRRRVAALPELMRVVIVTGRAPQETLDLLGVSGITVIGEHGLTMLRPDDDAPVLLDPIAYERAPALDALLAGHADELHRLGVIDQRLGPAIHSLHAGHGRKAARRWKLLHDIETELLEAGFQARKLRGALDVRAVRTSKAAAAPEVLSGDADAIVLVGDDLSDIDLWNVVHPQLPAGRCLRVGVLQRHGPTAKLTEAADFTVSGSRGVRRLLRQVQQALDDT